VAWDTTRHLPLSPRHENTWRCASLYLAGTKAVLRADNARRPPRTACGSDSPMAESEGWVHLPAARCAGGGGADRGRALQTAMPEGRGELVARPAGSPQRAPPPAPST